MAWPVQIFRLVSKPTEPGLFCGRDELTLGGAPLLTATRSGLGPRPTDELQRIFDTAYGSAAGINAESRLSGLRAVARALEQKDLCRATITSLFLKLPDIDPVGMTRLAKAGYDESELRDERGRWTSGGGNSTRSAASQTRRAAPRFNAHPSRGVNGAPARRHGRWPDTYGRDPNIIAVQGGVAVPFPPLAGPGVSSVYGGPKPRDDDDDFDDPPYMPEGATRKPANDDADSDSSTATNDNNPKVCPDPSYEVSSGKRRPEELGYQAQITGLPLGYHVMLNGVGYDGCRESDNTMLEAKNISPWFLYIPEDEFRTMKEHKKIDLQAFRQNYGSGGRKVEWWFSDPMVAYFFGEKSLPDTSITI